MLVRIFFAFLLLLKTGHLFGFQNVQHIQEFNKIAENQTNTLLQIIGSSDIAPGESKQVSTTLSVYFNITDCDYISVSGDSASVVSAKIDNWSQSGSNLYVKFTLTVDNNATPGSTLNVLIFIGYSFSGGTDGSSFDWTINVTSSSTPVVNFFGTPASGTAPLTVQFTEPVSLKPPQNLTASVSDNSIILDWDPPGSTCSNADTLLISYDDGSEEAALTTTAANYELCVRFTPSTYPATLLGLFFAGGRSVSDNYGLRVYLYPNGMNSGPSGQPVFEGQIPLSQVGVNGGFFSGPITINSGDFYISLVNLEGTTKDFVVGLDNNSSDALRSWAKVGNVTALIKDLDYPGNLLINAFVTVCDNNSVLSSNMRSQEYQPYFSNLPEQNQVKNAKVNFKALSTTSGIFYDQRPLDNSSMYSTICESTLNRKTLSLTSNLQGFNIYRSTTSPVNVVDQNRIGNVSASTTNFTDTNVVGGTTYYYVVTADYVEGESVPSNEVGATIISHVPILPTSSTPQVAGSEFFVDINVGNSENPVSDLFGVSFTLTYDQTDFIEVVIPYSNNVIPGDFLGSDLVFTPNVNEAAGKVSVGLTRKAGQGGVSGYGTITKVKFVANSNTPDGTQVTFSLTELLANDQDGKPIPLAPDSLIVTINGGIIVWPGDTNNDSIVNQADVLPIGLYWEQTSPQRVNTSISWVGQVALPWSNLPCTYADANGDGKVDQADVLPIGLNWGRIHDTSTISLSKTMTNFQSPQNNLQPILLIYITGKPDPGEEFFIDIFANQVENLFGLSFELVYSPNTFIEPLYAEIGSGNLLGADLVFFPNVDNVAAKVSIGLSRKAGQGGVNGSGLVTRIKTKMSPNAIVGQDTTWLSLKNVQANDHSGNPIQFDITNATLVPLITDVETALNDIIPNEFALHQNFPNPFNPETTIQYHLPKTSLVKLLIYNLAGQQVATLVDEKQAAGIYTVSWNGKDNYGRNVSSGIYLYRLETKDYVQVRKLTLLR